jgi:hypothetical protein
MDSSASLDILESRKSLASTENLTRFRLLSAHSLVAKSTASTVHRKLTDSQAGLQTRSAHLL